MGRREERLHRNGVVVRGEMADGLCHPSWSHCRWAVSARKDPTGPWRGERHACAVGVDCETHPCGRRAAAVCGVRGALRRVPGARTRTGGRGQQGQRTAGEPRRAWRGAVSGCRQAAQPHQHQVLPPGCSTAHGAWTCMRLANTPAPPSGPTRAPLAARRVLPAASAHMLQQPGGAAGGPSRRTGARPPDAGKFPTASHRARPDTRDTAGGAQLAAWLLDPVSAVRAGLTWPQASAGTPSQSRRRQRLSNKRRGV